MKTYTKKTTNDLAFSSHLSRWATLLLILCWGFTPGYGQYPQEVLNVTAPTPSRQGTTGSWTVPAGGPYKIRVTAKGAKGGSSFYGVTGGSGATMQGEFIVASGQVLSIVTGASGENGSSGGGGGGSGVRIQDDELLIVAGGGGGAYALGALSGSGMGGMVSNTGSSGGTGLVCGGCAKGAGGGYTSDGFSLYNGNGGGGAGFNGSGGVGGDGGGNGGGGVGGGGAGGASLGGGGGGYSGGNTYQREGGGGGSYNMGSNQINTGGTNNGGGQVVIENLGPASLSATVTPNQPTCAIPTQGSVTLDITGDFDGIGTGFECAIVSGSAFTGSPAFTDIIANPLSVSSGFGTTGDIDGETYTVRIRAKYNPGLFVDNTYTLTSPPQPTLTLGDIQAICSGATSFNIPYSASSHSPTSYTITGQGIIPVTDESLPGSPIPVNLSAPALAGSINFVLTVKNAVGCVSESIPGSVTVNALPTASISANNGLICAGQDASFIVSGTSGATLTYTLTGQADPQPLVFSGGSQIITANNVSADVTLTLVSVEKDGCAQNLSDESVVLVGQPPMVEAGSCRTIYRGYGESCTTLTATADQPDLNYTWTGGLSGASMQVCPAATTTYTVTATNISGCVSSAQLSVEVLDIRDVEKDGKVEIWLCNGKKSESKKAEDVAKYLEKGWTLGRCEQVPCSGAPMPIAIQVATRCNVVYRGYGSGCLMLAATATGGYGTLTYHWGPGLDGASVQVCPDKKSKYTLTVTDAHGYVATEEVEVDVQDVRCGKDKADVELCHEGKNICVAASEVAAHLDHGDKLGKCSDKLCKEDQDGASRQGVSEAFIELPVELAVEAYPNPTSGPMTLRLRASVSGEGRIELLDLTGRVVQGRAVELEAGDNALPLDVSGQAAGLYILRVQDAAGRQGAVRVSRQ